MNIFARSLIGLTCLSLSMSSIGKQFDYQLQAKQVAKDTYVVVGKSESFSSANGGNIANTGFVVTAQGVILFDTGPSLRYGTQLRTLIGKITDQPIQLVLNSHLHPDHFLGNGAFSDAPVHSSLKTIQQLQVVGDDLATGLYDLVGDWMRDTQVHMPTPIATGQIYSDQYHDIELIELEGHSTSDLMLYDRHTGVLFAGDLVFFNRAPTTPHATVPNWMTALSRINQLQPRIIVPGHGQPTDGLSAMQQTNDYLIWLAETLTDSAEQGLHFHEVKQLQAPFEQMKLKAFELERSLIHLYRDIEIQHLY